MGKRIELTKVRLAFESVFETRRIEGSDRDLYSGNGIFPKEHPAYKLLEDAAVVVATEEWTTNAQKFIDLAKKKDGGKNWALKDGNNQVDKNGDIRDGYAGSFYVAPNSKTRPTVINRDGSPLTAKDGVIYSGCYVDMIVEVYAYNHPTGGRGVSSELKGVRFREDGDAFSGGAPVTADAFSAIAEDDDIAF